MKNLRNSKCIGVINRRELSEILGISQQKLAYHLRVKSIEIGKKKIGKRFFYTPEQAKEIVDRLAGVIPK